MMDDRSRYLELLGSRSTRWSPAPQWSWWKHPDWVRSCGRGEKGRCKGLKVKSQMQFVWIFYFIFFSPTSDVHLVGCCLKNTGLKISPNDLALSWFLSAFWQTLEKCLSRHCRVSQYWGGRVGELAMRRSNWAHSSGFAASVGGVGGDKKK